MTQGLELRGAVLGKGYRLGRRLDTDDTSAYEATHERLPGRFIIRVFPPESLVAPESSSRIQRGARVASLLRDPHAVQVLDCNASGEMPAFVVIERVPGRSLAEVMADDGMLPLARVIDLVESLAAALAAGHQIGLVHGDIRPANVILPTSNLPPARLSGFGWAKELRAAARIPSPSGYLAPEQQLGKVLTLDERTDQFGLAALTYDMIAACLPFSEGSADLDGVLAAERVPPALAHLVPGVPRGIDEVLRRALAPTPTERFGSITEFASSLRAAVDAGAEADDPAAFPVAGAAFRRRPAADDGDGAGAGATPTRPSNDVTEELDLESLSPVLGDAEIGEDDLEEVNDRGRGNGWSSRAATPVRPRRGQLSLGAFDGRKNENDNENEDDDEITDSLVATRGGDDQPDVDDAQLVLGHGATDAPPSDEAKTQIVRSPFFEETEEFSDSAPVAAAPAPLSTFDEPSAPRRGLPVGRPSGGTASHFSTGMTAGTPVVVPLGGGRPSRSRPIQKTMMGIGPPVLPAFNAAPHWADRLKSRARSNPAVAGAALGGLAAVLAIIWLSSGGPDEPDVAAVPPPPVSAAASPAQPPPTTAPPAPAPTPAAPAAQAAPAPVPSPPAAEPLPPAPATSPPAPAAAARGQGPIIARVQPLPAASVKPGQGAPSNSSAGAAAKAAGVAPDQASARRPPPERPQPPPVAARRPPPVAKPPGTLVASGKATPAASTASANAGLAPDACAIKISSRPWAEVWIDGKDTGHKTPLDTFKVPCGTRKLELKRPDQDIEQMEMLDVHPGKLYRGSYELE